MQDRPDLRLPQNNSGSIKMKIFTGVAIVLVVIVGISIFLNKDVSTESKPIANQTTPQTDTTPKNDKAKESPKHPDEPTYVTQAEQAFVAYHQDITNQHYTSAYASMTPRMQEQIGSLQDYASGYISTLSSKVSNMQVQSANDEMVVLTYTLTARDRLGNGVKVQTFNGTVTLLKQNNSWKIDEMAATKINESRE